MPAFSRPDRRIGQARQVLQPKRLDAAALRVADPHLPHAASRVS
jgi:hypothetical protein